MKCLCGDAEHRASSPETRAELLFVRETSLLFSSWESYDSLRNCIVEQGHTRWLRGTGRRLPQPNQTAGWISTLCTRGNFLSEIVPHTQMGVCIQILFHLRLCFTQVVAFFYLVPVTKSKFDIIPYLFSVVSSWKQMFTCIFSFSHCLTEVSWFKPKWIYLLLIHKLFKLFLKPRWWWA